MNLSRVVVIVAVTAAIVYAGLNYLLPRGQKSPAVAVATAAAEAPPSTDATTAPEAAAEPAESIAAAASETSADDSATGATAEDPALTDEEARRIAANVAAEVTNASDGASEAPAAAAETDTAVLDDAAAAPESAPESAAEAPVETAPSPEPAAVADAGASALTDEQARRIAANIAAESAGAAEEPAPAAAPAPAPKPAPAPEKVVAEAAAEPAPAVNAPKAPKPVRKDPPNAAPTGKTGNGADVISAWWKKPGSASSGLNLVYAGEASSEKAVVLMFDDAVDAAAAGSQIKLIDAKGGTPSGSWSSGNNPRLIAFKGVAAGRYTVIVGAGMTSAGGKSVGSELVGPVYVH